MNSTISIIIIILCIFQNTMLNSQCTSATCTTSNTFMGSQAGASNQNGGANSFFGAEAGLMNAGVARGNSFFGIRSGQRNVSGNNNSFFGRDSGMLSTSSGNSFFGSVAGANLASGVSNCFFGNLSGTHIVSGSKNICIGSSSGPTSGSTGSTASEKLYIDTEFSNSPLIYGDFQSDFATINGKLGVAASPLTDLDVHGSGIIRASNSSPRIQLYDNVSGINRVTAEFRELANNIYLESLRGDLFLRTGLNGSAITRATIKGSNGFVGIATGAPSQRLDVNGGIKVGSTNNNIAGSIRYNGTNFQGHHNGVWKNLDEDASAQVWNLSGTTAHYTNGKVGIGTDNPSAELHIKTLPGQNGMNIDIDNQRAMHVSGNRGVTIGNTSAPPSTGLAVTGDTGIGTNNPFQKLEVVGAIKIGTTAANIDGSIRYDGTNFQGHTGGSWVNLNGSSGSGGSVWTQSGTDATYTTGNVGIGTASPTHLLHVAGDLAVAGSIVAPSDLRLKKEITAIKDALDIVDQLQPKHYSYLETQTKEHGLPQELQYGLIAQELESVLPTLVSDQALIGSDGTAYKGIDYAQLIPILTQAIRELREENETLKVAQQKSTAITSTIITRLEKLEGI